MKVMKIVGVLFFLSILVCIVKAEDQDKIFNVLTYNASSNGNSENSKAFLNAWRDACKWSGKSTVLIPNGTYKLKDVNFTGPCNSSINFRLEGMLKAPIDPNSFASDNWINFKHVNKLMVGGGGSLDGQGAYAWKMNDCKKNPNCRALPTSMKFDYITNGYIHHMHSFNSKQIHFGLYECRNMTLTKLQIKAPGDSPNTDGIKIGKSRGINITSVDIRTGDDCISMLSGLSNVRIMDVYCGPGHGISIGSLGKYENEEDLADIIVKNCTLNGTSNGVRIKSYESQLNKTVVASNFIYEDIVMENVEHPIVIDQHYCPNSLCRKKGVSSVQIRNVAYKYIRGSGNSKFAATFNCIQSKPCQNITMENIDLWPSSTNGRLRNECSFVSGAVYGKQNPPACIK